MYKASNMTTFHNVSTNATPIALSDVTTEDLVSIMQNLVKKYGGDTWAPLITELYNHIINHNNPHQVIMEQIETKTIDVVYKQWIAEGYVGSKEDFLSIFFQYVDVATIDQFNTLLPYLVNSVVEANKDTLETKVPVILLIKEFIDWHNESLLSHKNIINKVFGDVTRGITSYVYPDRAISQLCGCGPSPYDKFYEADGVPELTAKNDGMVYGEVPITTMDGTKVAVNPKYSTMSNYSFLLSINLYPTTITTVKDVLILSHSGADISATPVTPYSIKVTIDYTTKTVVFTSTTTDLATSNTTTVQVGTIAFDQDQPTMTCMLSNLFDTLIIKVLNAHEKNTLVTLSDAIPNYTLAAYSKLPQWTMTTDCIQTDSELIPNPSIRQLITFRRLFTGDEILSLLQSKCPY